MKRFLEAGRLNSPRGIKGEIRFACYCDSPEFLSGIKRLYLDAAGKNFLEVALYRPSVPSFIFKGYEDRGLVSALNGRTVWFDREDFPLEDGVFYYDDIIGAPVFDAESGEKAGEVAGVEEGVSCFYYLIKAYGKCWRVPAVDEFILSADVEKGVTARLAEGLETKDEF
ncbi:MAG: 16S rRNA processing protein RimM [Clostridia bacterium]|nr:16S rRNA processing protein RimM [Clostridia bacterium]